MRGKWFIAGGLLLIAAAVGLTVYNLNEQTQATRSATDALQKIDTLRSPATESSIPEAQPDASEAQQEAPAYPLADMPELEIDGQQYVGILHVPALSLRLPIISEWSYPRLKIAPCRFRGSAYTNDLILLAHNYTSHFGTLVRLSPGDEVLFEDMAGNLFRYRVVEMLTLDGTQVEDMIAGDWDLTLFTCTVGGRSRVTVRCERVAS